MKEHNQKLTLRDIKEQLERQDRQTKRMVWLAGAMWSGSITFGAIFLWIGEMLPKYTFAINCLIFLFAGLVFFWYCFLKMRGLSKAKVGK